MPLVRVDRPADHIAVVTLDRPEVLNALSIDLAIELDRTLLEVSRDNTVRVIVLTGAGRASTSRTTASSPSSTASKSVRSRSAPCASTPAW